MLKVERVLSQLGPSINPIKAKKNEHEPCNILYMNQLSAQKNRILALKYPCQGTHKNHNGPPTHPLRDVFNAGPL